MERDKFDHEDRNTVVRQIRSVDGQTDYSVMVNGSRRRVSPKPWNGKSMRREVLRQRREQRLERDGVVH